jgi:hypothetical protein
MAIERKTGAGTHLGSVLERAPQPKPSVELEESEQNAGTKGRGMTSTLKTPRATTARTSKRVKGRTIYMGDDLYERILVQAHRKDLTISEYVCQLCERHVPDHRTIRNGMNITTEQGEQE